MSTSDLDGPNPQAPVDPPADPPAVSPAMERLARFSAANMLRSLLPLTLIILALVGFQAIRQGGDENRVTAVDSSSTVQFAARTAAYPLQAPTGLPDGWVTTSARTDAGQATAGDPVTLEIGFYTPGKEYAGYVSSDDARADQLRSVLDGATDEGSETIAGQSWDQLRTARGETAFTRQADGATLLVTGSASDEELATLAGALQPVPAS